jgi:hypothetical protein
MAPTLNPQPADRALHARVVPEALTLPVGETRGTDTACEAPIRPGQRDQIGTPLPPRKSRARHMATRAEKMRSPDPAGETIARFTVKSSRPQF